MLIFNLLSVISTVVYVDKKFQTIPVLLVYVSGLKTGLNLWSKFAKNRTRNAMTFFLSTARYLPC